MVEYKSQVFCGQPVPMKIITMHALFIYCSTIEVDVEQQFSLE